MNRKKQISLGLVGDFGALLQRNEGVIRPRINHLAIHPLFDQCTQSLRDVQHQILFAQSLRANSTCIVPTVPRVKNNPADL